MTTHKSNEDKENIWLLLYMDKVLPKKIDNNLYAILLLDMTLQRNLEKVRRDFVANVSHELKSPLTSLVGFIETLLSGKVHNDLDKNKFLVQKWLLRKMI